jgi:CRP/FNR family cyclic AMP-dependent transcriptional regulator
VTRSEEQQASAYASWDAALSLGTAWLQQADIGKVLRIEAHSALYTQGAHHDCFYLVRSGFVHTTVLRPNGTALLLEIFGPGAIFGEASAFINRPRYVTATAVTQVVLSQYHAADITRLAASQPELLLSLIKLLGIKHRLLIDKLASFTSQSPQQRIIDLLGRIAIAQQQARAANATLPQRLTHEQIGAMTGLSRVTVTRTLKALAGQGMVSTRTRGVEILDVPAWIERLAHR